MKKLVIILLFLSPYSYANDEYGCSIIEKSKVPYQKDGVNISITVKIEGASCDGSNITITVIHSDDKEVYSFVSEYSNLTQLAGDSREPREQARYFAKYLINIKQFQSCSKMVPLSKLLLDTPFEYYFLAKEKIYNSFVGKECVILTHPIRHESWRDVVIINDAQPAVILSEYGV